MGGAVAAQVDAGTTAEWEAARLRTRRRAYGTALVGLLILPAVLMSSMWLAEATVSGILRYPVAAGFDVLILIPLIAVMLRVNMREQGNSDELIHAITDELAAAVTLADRESEQRQIQASRQEFESRLANALDIADGEPEVIDVIERSFRSSLPATPIELLLADNSHAHLSRMAGSTDPPSPGCGVDSPDRCPAARRAQVQKFDHSDELDACPKLRGRAGGAVSAVCVPVSIMGRTVGVIHATGEPHAAFAVNGVQDLTTLAKLAGARIGLLRAMQESQLQAATDSLTGLLNRRSFEQQVAAVRRENALLTMAIADLDHFKQLNDTYGHETGDRALRLFAQVLAGSVRTQDIVGRHGGEEFVIALPGCTDGSARMVLAAFLARLAAAITVAGLPTFTVSIGVVEADPLEELPTVIGRADQALFAAKRNGRDQIVVHDAAGLVVQPDRHPAGSGTDGGIIVGAAVEAPNVVGIDRAAGHAVGR